MENKKYELRKELPLIMAGNKFYRIKSLRNFKNIADGREIKKGELGGYVLDESVLSQEGTCWIGKNGVIRYTDNLNKIEDDAYVDAIIDNLVCIANGNTVIIDYQRTFKFNTCISSVYADSDGNKFINIGDSNEDDDTRCYKLINPDISSTVPFREFSIPEDVAFNWEWTAKEKELDKELYIHEKVNKFLKDNEYDLTKLDYKVVAVLDKISNKLVCVL